MPNTIDTVKKVIVMIDIIGVRTINEALQKIGLK